MRVNGTKTETVSIDISECDLIENVINLIASRTDLKERWIQEGWVCQDDPHWRHGSVGTDRVRKASKDDIWNYEMLEQLKKFQLTLK